MKLLVLSAELGLTGKRFLLEFLDELSGFEKAWQGNAQKHLPGLTGNLNGYVNTG